MTNLKHTTFHSYMHIVHTYHTFIHTYIHTYSAYKRKFTHYHSHTVHTFMYKYCRYITLPYTTLHYIHIYIYIYIHTYITYHRGIQSCAGSWTTTNLKTFISAQRNLLFLVVGKRNCPSFSFTASESDLRLT